MEEALGLRSGALRRLRGGEADLACAPSSRYSALSPWLLRVWEWLTLRMHRQRGSADDHSSMVAPLDKAGINPNEYMKMGKAGWDARIPCKQAASYPLSPAMKRPCSSGRPADSRGRRERP